MSEAECLIALLGLKPHPEGGHYRQVFQDVGSAGGRAHSTAIYYLLRAGEESRAHRIDAAEIWHYYRGDALELVIAQEGRPAARQVLGSDIERGQRPQIVVPAGAWQAAKPLGAFTLAGCTVAPGFVFETFELAPPDFKIG